jgi:hypothetical protein
MTRVVTLSVLTCSLSLLGASAAALVAYVHIALGLSLTCSGNPAQGANLVHGIAIAFFGGILASILLVLVRTSEKTVLVGVTLTACLLAGALIFVALDSATYLQLDRQCTDFGFGPFPNSTGRFGYLYPTWGAVVAVMLTEAAYIAIRLGYLRTRRPRARGVDR